MYSPCLSLYLLLSTLWTYHQVHEHNLQDLLACTVGENKDRTPHHQARGTRDMLDLISDADLSAYLLPLSVIIGEGCYAHVFVSLTTLQVLPAATVMVVITLVVGGCNHRRDSQFNNLYNSTLIAWHASRHANKKLCIILSGEKVLGAQMTLSAHDHSSHQSQVSMQSSEAFTQHRLKKSLHCKAGSWIRAAKCC